MRMIALLVLSLSCLLSQSSYAQSALDAHMIEEHAMLYNYPPVIIDYMETQARGEFSVYYDLQQVYSYVFREDEAWARRVWRRIDVKGDFGAAMRHGYKGYGGERDSSTALLHLIDMGLAEGQMTPFDDYDWNVPLVHEEAKKQIPDIHETTAILLKEDYCYDKETGESNKYIIGLGLEMTSDQDTKDVWFYYPELRYVIDEYYSSEWNWDVVLQNGQYDSEIYDSEPPRGMYFQGMGEGHVKHWKVAVEMDAIFWAYEVERLSLLRRPEVVVDRKYTLEIESLPVHRTEGPLNGTQEIYFESGEVKVTMHFLSGKAHGTYKKFYQDGGLEEEGEFACGVKVGEWKSYHANGELHAIRHYENGWLSGSQENYYPNGEPWLQFTYEGMLPNGSFSYWLEDGTLLMTGELTEGLKKGIWKYNLPVSTALGEYISVNQLRFSQLGINGDVLSDGLISFDEERSWAYMSGCPYGICVISETVSDYR